MSDPARPHAIESEQSVRRDAVRLLLYGVGVTLISALEFFLHRHDRHGFVFRLIGPCGGIIAGCGVAQAILGRHGRRWQVRIPFAVAFGMAGLLVALSPIFLSARRSHATDTPPAVSRSKELREIAEMASTMTMEAVPVVIDAGTSDAGQSRGAAPPGRQSPRRYTR